MWDKLMATDRKRVLIGAAIAGALFLAAEVALMAEAANDASARCTGPDTKEIFAFALASLAAGLSGVDILVAEKVSGWSLASAYLSIGAASLVGPIDCGLALGPNVRFIALAIFVAFLIVFTVLYIKRFRDARDAGARSKDLSTGNKGQAAEEAKDTKGQQT